MLTAVSLASALLFTSLSSIVVILCLAGDRHFTLAKPGVGRVDGVAVGGNGGRRSGADQCDQQFCRVRHDYVMGFIKDATGSFSLALVTSGRAGGGGAWAIVWIGHEQAPIALREDKAAARYEFS